MEKHLTIPREVIVHTGFHLLWALFARLSVAGGFLLIPLVAFYETFVLGFLFGAMPHSRVGAYGIGLLVFVGTGLASAAVRRLVGKQSSWTAGFLSLILVLPLLIITSMLLLPSTVGGQGPLVQGARKPHVSDASDFGQLGVWIKAACYLAKHPPFVAHAASVVRLETALPSLAGATAVPAPKVSGWYLNLDAACWSALRDRATSSVVVAWSDVTNNRCDIVRLDLTTDVVSVETVQIHTLERLYKTQRNVIVELCSDADLPDSLPTK